MRFFILTLLSAISLLAGPKDINSFHSSFTQTIIDEHKKKIVYNGELWASKPQNALWMYKKPIQKSVYISGSKLTLIEPVIEQATIRTLNDEIDFLEIIKKAKPMNAAHYTATVNGQTYFIEFSGDTLSSISYTDGYENKVIIQFLNPDTNKPIDASRFKPSIPTGFDIIRG
ncbi:MAG TPA: LolA-like outer membrane lipoprotein chaperone [Sulfuricurvum sp.]|nr:LolA-like outer membrane lipoprotein chaperone [Sulfuricurvum sp.]